MNAQKIRSLLVIAMLAMMLVVGNVMSAAAQTLTPIPIGCSFHGKQYPVGTVLRFLLPEPEPTYVYMRCELKFSAQPGGGAQPQWVIYGSNPSS